MNVLTHIVDEGTGVRVSFLEPNGYVLTLGHQRRVTTEVGRVLMRVHLRAIERMGDRPLVGIMDWATMEGYDSEARSELTEWGKSIRNQIQACCMIAPELNPVVKMGLQVAGTALRVVGVRFEFYSSVEDAMEKYALTPSSR